VVRDGQSLRQSVTAALGSPDDREIAVQLLASDERLPPDSLLLGFVVLDAAGAPASPGALVGYGSWTAATLREELSAETRIPFDQLAVAKLPPHTELSPSSLGGLIWDEAEVSEAPRLSDLSDGDVLVVRDRLHPPPVGRAKGPLGKGTKKVTKFCSAALAEERAVRIRTVFDEPGVEPRR